MNEQMTEIKIKVDTSYLTLSILRLVSYLYLTYLTSFLLVLLAKKEITPYKIVSFNLLLEVYNKII